MNSHNIAKVLLSISICVLLTGCDNKVVPIQENDINTDIQQPVEDSEVSDDLTKVTGAEDAVKENDEIKEEEQTEEDVSYESVSNEYMGHTFKDGIVLPDIDTKQYILPENEAISFINDLAVGISLGNTFDAYKDDGFSDEMKIEEYWQGVHTTPELIKYIHDLGFGTIRIPVSWHNHISDDVQISEQWLDRVEEVAHYALDEGMYVIIDIHHDNHLKDVGIYPDRAHLEQSKHYISRIWTQIGERFADEDEHLIFEGMNEPRLVGHENEWEFNNAKDDCVEAAECINELNQTFVDTVRSLGGNNASRYLMCPGYTASVGGAFNPWFKLPTDNGGYDNRIILSIHAYTPYNFALEYPGVKTFDYTDKSSTSDIDVFMSKLYTEYIYKGIPVIIGEFGARNKEGNLKDRVDYAAYFTATARSRGIPVIWWDNNEFNGSGENFGIVNRRDPDNSTFEIIAALMKYKDR